MGNNARCRGVLASNKLIERLGSDYILVKKLLLEERFSHGDAFEKLHVSEKSQVVFSLRINQKSRLLLTKHELEGQCYWVLLEVLENHQYERSNFLKKGYRKKYFSLLSTNSELLQNIKDQALPLPSSSSSSLSSTPIPLSSSSSSLSSTPISPSSSSSSLSSTPISLSSPSSSSSVSGDEEEIVSHRELHIFNNELIALSERQELALRMPEPMLLMGVPGSGKSCVALTYLSQFSVPASSSESSTPQYLLYVTESKLLAKRMESTFRASLIGKESLSKHFLFLSYEELAHREYPELRDLKVVDKLTFYAWCEHSRSAHLQALKAWLGLKAHELIYQELRMMSGMTLEDYESISERESPLFNRNINSTSTPEESKTTKVKYRRPMYELKKQYLDYLEHNGHYDLSFIKLKSSPRPLYSHIAVDEAQDLSTVQLLNIHQLANKNNRHQPCVAYFADSNQSVEDNFPKINFFKRFLAVDRIGELPGTFRCSRAVTKVANEVLRMKYHILGGALEKEVLAFIDEHPGTIEGTARFVAECEKQQDKETQELIAGLITTTECAIITPEEEVEDAKKRFKGAIVLTPKQVKGLEYPYIILYRMLNRPCNHLLNPFLEDYEIRTPSAAKKTVHRAKLGEAHYEYNAPINELFTAITRARLGLFIVQDTDKPKVVHPFRYLLNAIKSALSASSTIPTKPLSAATKEDWIKEIRRHIGTGNVSIASELAMEHLKMTQEQFNQEFCTPRSDPTDSSATHRESKEEKKTEKTNRFSSASVKPEGKDRAIGMSPMSSTPRVISESTSSSSSSQPKHLSEGKDSVIGENFMSSKPTASPKSTSSSSSTPPKSISALKTSHVVQARPYLLSEKEHSLVADLAYLLSLYEKDIFLYAKENKTYALVDELFKENGWLIFTAALANHSFLLRKTPLKEILIRWRTALRTNQREDVQHLLDAQRAIKAHSDNELPQIMLAVFSRNIKLIQQLHRLGANLNLSIGDGLTPAFVAAQLGHVEVLRVLHQLGADLNTPMHNGDTPAFIATHKGYVKVLRALHELGVDLNTPMKDGATLAYIAAREGHVEVLRVLHQLGADLNTMNDEATPVFIATEKGHVKVLRALHELGANVNTPTKYGATPAHIAAREGHVEMLRVLHQLGANLNTPMNDGTTPVFVAARNGQVESLQLLIKCGVNLDLTWRTKSVDLISYGKNYSEEIQSRLQRFLVLDKNKEKEQVLVSPLEIAQIMGHKKIVHLLSHIGEPEFPMKEYGLFSPSVSSSTSSSSATHRVGHC